tara:strand:+ start:17984 stop:18514 length:531 start_codon:yes stop_codon:yes gene_type:complete
LPVAKFFIEDDIVDEHEYRKWDIITKIAMFVVALIVVVCTWISNVETRKKEFQLAYYNERVKAISTLLEIFGSLHDAGTENAKAAIVSGYWKLIMGDAIVYFSPAMNYSLKRPTQYISKCIEKFDKSQIDDVNCNLSILAHTTEFSLAARRELAGAWNINFGDIAVDNPLSYKTKN